MASFWYDVGLQGMTSGGGIAYTSDTLKVMLVQSGYTFDKTHATITAVLTGGSEISVASYVRGTLGTKAKNFDSASQEVRFDAADQDFGALESGQTIEAAIVYKEVTNDSDSIPIFYCDDPSDLILNGGNVTVQWPATGIGIINGNA